MRCRIDHTAVGPNGSIELLGLAGQLEAGHLRDVTPVLSEVEAAARQGWYVAGFVAYEAAPAFDAAFRVNAAGSQSLAPPGLPLAWFGLFREAVPARALPPAAPPGRQMAASGPPGWTCEADARSHAAAITAIRAAIADGDAYLVNYTTRFRRQWTPDDDAFQLYRRLLASYGRGYHAFFETDQWAVACGSPELFFERRGDALLTRPMKGTAPRGRWAEEDIFRAHGLWTSAKERAENVMVVDLLRNDLGRIAVNGTVTVPALWQVEQHPSLWQLTSTVAACAGEGVGLAEIFGALFPCASVTGAPKVSAMSLIADCETSPRGVYCGATGFLPPRQGPRTRGGALSARFAVAIRTAVVDKTRGVAEYGSGGGITWDSAPEQEWEEVLLKARALSGPPAPTLSADEALVETMAFVPPPAGPGMAIDEVRNLDAHLARLTASARYFGRVVPPGIEEMVAGAVRGLRSMTRVRILLRADEAIELQTSALDDERPVSSQQLCIDFEPVSSSDVKLFHKTTDRERYEDRAHRHPAADDVVLVNERGEVTETTRANLAVRINGQWCTPPLSCGLLPGVERARQLADGRLVERVVTVEDLLGAPAVATLSSLRGWRAAHVRASCGCGTTLARDEPGNRR
jgi:para-aminobenzoate synthetase/4-amino-4-deoxychorismate lyase